jgi:methyl-accepting chemotaxis protein
MPSPDRYLKTLLVVWIGATAILAWLSYGDAARRIIASSYRQLAWLVPPTAPIADNAPDTTGLSSQAAPSPNQEPLNAMSLDLEATRQSVDRIAITQEQIMRNIDELTAGQEQITRNVDQLTAAHEQMTRNVDRLTAHQDQMMDGITKLQAVEQQILHKNPEPAPRPAPALARTPLRRSSLAPAVR